MKNLSFAVVVFICCIAPSTLAVAQEASTGDQKQQLRESAKSALQSARLAVKGSGESLNSKVEAHKILARDLGDSMPSDLAEGLNRELRVLQFLQRANSDVLGPIIDAEMSLVDEKNQVSIEDIDKMVRTADLGFDQLQTALKSKRESRQEVKKHINNIIDSLIAANPGKIPTYVTVKTELDPDMLDLEMASQKTILASLVVVLNSLKW